MRRSQGAGAGGMSAAAPLVVQGASATSAISRPPLRPTRDRGGRVMPRNGVDTGHRDGRRSWLSCGGAEAASHRCFRTPAPASRATRPRQGSPPTSHLRLITSLESRSEFALWIRVGKVSQVGASFSLSTVGADGFGQRSLTRGALSAITMIAALLTGSAPRFRPSRIGSDMGPAAGLRGAGSLRPAFRCPRPVWARRAAAPGKLLAC